jgi:hypothetical protein
VNPDSEKLCVPAPDDGAGDAEGADDVEIEVVALALGALVRLALGALVGLAGEEVHAGFEAQAQ